MICCKCKKSIEDESLYCQWCGKKQTKTAAPKPLKRANGTGTVYKLSGRRTRPWAAALNKTIVGYYAEKTEAYKALEAYANNGISDYLNDTLENIYERWKDSHFRDLTPKGQEGYEMAWKRLAPLHSYKIRNIKTKDYQKIIDEATTMTKDAKPLSRSGKEKIKQLCSQLSKQAIQDEIINRNYGEFIKLDKEERKEKEVFSTEEINIIAQSNDRVSKIILVLIYTGFRINELFSIRRKDVNLEENLLIGGEKTEAGKDRLVPISPKIRPIIEEWFAEGNEYLVTSKNGFQMNSQNFRNREYYPLLESLGIKKKNPHCTRHTFATLMATAGVRPEVLQKIIGHADYSTTANIYIHSDNTDLQDAIMMISSN